MRLLTRRIYRAFPELDRFDDARCERFVRAARRGRRAMLGRALAVLATLVGGVVGLLALTGWLGEQATRLNEGPARSVLILAAVACAAGAILGGPVGAFLVRDWLLRRRVRHVIRARGVCASCGYSLIGAPISPECEVCCPECAFQTVVDPALGELTRDAAGQARFEPRETSRPPRIFTPGRVRTLKRTARWAAVFLPVLALVGAVGYEWHLRWQASQAAGERPRQAGLLAFVQHDQPKEGANGWDVFARAYDVRVQAEIGADPAGRFVDADGKALTPVFDYLYSPVQKVVPDDAATRRRVELEGEYARVLLQRYASAGLFDRLDELAACPRAVRPITLDPRKPAADIALPQLGQARQFSRINGARLAAAWDARDAPEVERSLRRGFALARLCHRQVFMIEYLVGCAIEAFQYARIRERIEGARDPALVEACAAALRHATPRPPLDRAFRGEAILALDTIGWMFEDPARARFGRFSKNVFNLVGASALPRRPLGTYAQNRRDTDAWENYWTRESLREPWERLANPAGPPPPHTYALSEALRGSEDRSIRAAWMAELERRGTLLMIALERHRLAQGTYPESLADLAPALIDPHPVDPWSGKPFGYRRLPATDEHGRGYVLYSVGADGTDDGGADLTNPHSALQPGAPGKDFVLNAPRPK